MEAIVYDRTWYERYDCGSDLDETKKYLEYAATFELIRDLPHCGTALDIGTATGRYVLAFERQGYHSMGIDVSAEAVEVARGNLEALGADSARIQQMHAQQMSFSSGSFNLVSCMMGTLAHIAQPARALAEIHRVLAPGGVALLSNWQPGTAGLDFLKVNTDSHNLYLSEKSPSLEKVVSLVADAGLMPERHAYAVFLPTTILGRLIDCCEGEPAGHLERLSSLEVRFRQLFPRLRGQILVLLARKPR